MSSENDKAFLQYKEDDVEAQNEKQNMEVGIMFDIRQIILNFKQLKSLEILKLALKIFTSNIKFMLLTVLSILPYFVCMFLYEIKLQNSIIYATLNYPGKPQIIYMSELLDNSITRDGYDDNFSLMNKRREFVSDILQLSLFYMFVYPLLEFFSMVLTMKTAAELHAAENPSTLSLREMLNQKINLKGPFITYLCVHLLSSSTLLALFWIVSNHILTLGEYYPFMSFPDYVFVFSVIVHSVMFLGLLYKYLDWSASWNMSMAISVLMEEHTGIEAFGMSDYCGKHCKKTGLQLMLGFFVFGNGLRLPCLYAGLCDGSFGGGLIRCIVMMLVSMGNLMKWVAFVLHFYYCKQQTMGKKVDDQEQVETVNAGNQVSIE